MSTLIATVSSSGLLGSKGDWYLMRASGFVCLGLFTLTSALGVTNLLRSGRRRWSSGVGTLVHRSVSLLAMLFLAIHVITAVLDSYVSIPLAAVVLPGVSGYDPLWVGLGAVALDLMVAMVLTSLIRDRIRHGLWRTIHWAAYLCWPLAIFHGIGSGSGSGLDTSTGWAIGIYALCGLIGAGALWYRLAFSTGTGTPTRDAERSAFSSGAPA